MFTIRVFREMGGAAAGKKVTVSTSFGVKTATTNSNGDANFDMPAGKNYKVHVDGKIVHDGAIVGVQIVYI